MEDFDIGKRGITVVMDRPRELIFDLGSFRFMEDLAHRWIKKSGMNIRDIVGPAQVPTPNGMVFNPAVITTGHIIANMGLDNFLTIALMGAMLHDYRKERDKLTTELADQVYEAFLVNGGDRNELVEHLAEAYGRARNPHKLKKIREEAEKEAEMKEDPGGETSSD